MRVELTINHLSLTIISMETTSQNKIARLIQKELSEIFLLQTKSMHGVLVSVSAVRISPDLSIARVYLSIFPSEKGRGNRQEYQCQHEIHPLRTGNPRASSVAHHSRAESSSVDDSLDYLEHIDELLK